MTRYSVIAHSDSFTIREEGTGDILTFSLREKVEVHAICNLLNAAYNRGQEDGAQAQLVSDALNDGCPVNPVRYGYPTGAHDVSDRVTETWRANAAREGWETSL